MGWKWTKRIGFGLAGLVTALAVSGAVYQTVCTKSDQKKFPPIGQMVDIGGYRLHIHSMGKGGPTVVLDAGLGCNSLDWALVQPKVAAFTKVVSIDRAGNGWSDESPLKRTSENIVKEMHSVLHKAGIEGPYILVGHSFGGMNARLFASKYPDEVSGAVLVDSTHENQFEKIPLPKNNETLMMLMIRLGITRLANNPQKFMQMFPNNILEKRVASTSTTKFMRSVLQESAKLEESSAQLKKAGGFLGDKPLTVITAAKTCDPTLAQMKQEEVDKIYTAFQEFQKDLVTKSTNGKQIIAEKSDHMIPWHQPDLIVDAIHEQVKLHNAAR